MNKNTHTYGSSGLTGAIAAAALMGASAFAPALNAEGPAERGLAIAVEAERRDTGVGDHIADVKMVLYNRHGEMSDREMKVSTLEQTEDGDKSLVFFETPRDVRGTAFLTHTHKVGNDDQWLYLPALKRVKRIASGNKSGPFVGSEFAYEDISSQEVEKYTYNYLREEDLDGIRCFVIERYPVDPKSGYTRQVVWVDTEEYRERKIDFYDRKSSLLKTLTYEGYRQYLDQYWRADRYRMVNHQNGKSTDLEWKGYRFQVGLGERDFDQRSLMNGRLTLGSGRTATVALGD
jgi:hypothetical protein